MLSALKFWVFFLALTVPCLGNNDGLPPLDGSQVRALAIKARELSAAHKESVEAAIEGAKDAMLKKGKQGRCPLNQDCFKNRGNSFHRGLGGKLKQTSKIFVSSSMPKASLIQLALEAKHYGAQLIIRGMVNNSMKETGQLVKEINYPLDIDPKLFQKHQITQVPTFLIPATHEGKTTWKTLRGNVELGFALEKAAEKEPKI